MTLEEKIRDVAARGELTHLSVVPVAGGWSASFAHASGYGTSFAQDPDPVKAMIKALGMPKLARLRMSKPNQKDDENMDFG